MKSRFVLCGELETVVLFRHTWVVLQNRPHAGTKSCFEGSEFESVFRSAHSASEPGGRGLSVWKRSPGAGIAGSSPAQPGERGGGGEEEQKCWVLSRSLDVGCVPLAGGSRSGPGPQSSTRPLEGLCWGSVLRHQEKQAPHPKGPQWRDSGCLLHHRGPWCSATSPTG